MDYGTENAIASLRGIGSCNGAEESISVNYRDRLAAIIHTQGMAIEALKTTLDNTRGAYPEKACDQVQPANCLSDLISMVDGNAHQIYELAEQLRSRI